MKKTKVESMILQQLETRASVRKLSHVEVLEEELLSYRRSKEKILDAYHSETGECPDCLEAISEGCTTCGDCHVASVDRAKESGYHEPPETMQEKQVNNWKQKHGI